MKFEFSSPLGAWVRVAASVLQEEKFVKLWGEMPIELSDRFNLKGMAGWEDGINKDDFELTEI